MDKLVKDTIFGTGDILHLSGSCYQVYHLITESTSRQFSIQIMNSVENQVWNKMDAQVYNHIRRKLKRNQLNQLPSD